MFISKKNLESKAQEHLLIYLDGKFHKVPADIFLINTRDFQSNIDRLNKYFQEGEVAKEVYDYCYGFIKQFEKDWQELNLLNPEPDE